VAEASRTPFDFSEGESELVSGFNVEYGGGLFSIIFVCEYGMLLFFSFLTGLVFFGGGVFKSFILSFFFL
jgi:NADH-ubiquinone oxidoreductase chain 1